VPVTPRPLQQTLRTQLRGWAREIGFADAAVSTLNLDDDLAHLRRWLDQGRHGCMAWMERDTALRAEPARLRPGTVSVISARLDYRPPAEQAEAVLANSELAYISRYALGRDYHKLMRARLKKLAARIAEEIAPHGYRVLADSAPSLEKALARNAGLGWIGKNTLVLNREAGSWFFLGEIYTDLPLQPDSAEPPANRCGSCTACIDICPTQAITGPYQLDARRCISYLTIEHHGEIPEELRPLIGNRIFGCDDCQLACPWNKYARQVDDPAFAPRHGLDAAKLVELFAWSEEEWLQRTEGMALRRAGYARWQRNLAVALGNVPPTAASSACVRAALDAQAAHSDPLVRLHIEWAQRRHPPVPDNKPMVPRAYGS
jgi:epoxyqueuosine reductase